MKILLSAGLVVAITELGKRNTSAAAVPLDALVPPPVGRCERRP